MIDLVLYFALGMAPADLGSPSWKVRESATQRIEAVGPLAVPTLRSLTESENPEVRYRARSLLAPWQRRWDRARAWWVLIDPKRPNIVSVYRDHALRYHLWEIDRAIYGGSDTRFDPAHDGGAFECWLFNEYPWERLGTALDILRARIRQKPN